MKMRSGGGTGIHKRPFFHYDYFYIYARMAELVDATGLKPVVCKGVGVQVPLLVLYKEKMR
tara:strand:+ start:4253 stop:4435 length:183 start_codon:yes stop_codon:yes gene_type:complete